MTYNELIAYLMDGVRRSLSEDAEVTFLKIPQINRDSVDVLRVVRTGQIISPAICVRDYWNRYYAKEASPETLLHEIVSIYEISINTCGLPESHIKDYSEARKHLYPILLNPLRNRELLVTTPHQGILDLTIVSAVFTISKTKQMTMSIVGNRMLKNWGISSNRLMADTVANQQNLLTPMIVPIEDMISELTEEKAKCGARSTVQAGEINAAMTLDDRTPYGSYDMNSSSDKPCGSISGDEKESGNPQDEKKAAPDSIPMYVMTNRLHHYGASSILDRERLMRFSEALDSDLYILPSSIHEVILIKKDEEHLPQFQRMVQDINSFAVSENDWLSDGVYEWNRATGQISVAGSY